MAKTFGREYMRNVFVGLVSTFLFAGLCLGQEVKGYKAGGIDQPSMESNAVPGCRVLWKEEQALQKYVQQHPEVLAAPKTAQLGPWNFHVGDTKAWWATNLGATPQYEYPVPSTCRKVGIHAYYFVEDSLWNNGRVTQAQVDSIASAFDFRTPASRTKGIYQTDVETFGNPPDEDLDSLIIILILDIKDGFSGSGTFVAGYFFSVNEFPDGSPAIGSHRSNYAEIYYVDGVQDNLSTPNGLATAIETTAHEFQHMIHWHYDKNEITFINEGCSMVAEVVCGFSVSFQSSYTSDTNVYLLQWNSANPIPDYARAQRWVLYLWNQFPNGYLKLLVQNTGTGITGIDGALSQYSPAATRRFADVFQDWLVANTLNDQSVNPKYGYTYTGTLLAPLAKSFVNPNTGVQLDTVVQLGARYITFTAGANLNITFNSASAALVIKAIEVGPSSKKVVDVQNGAFRDSTIGTTYTSITFAVINTSQTVGAPYTYQATGTGPQAVELKYDDGQPEGYLVLSPGDSISVNFDGVPGAQLDSLRIAFRRAGTMRMGIWTFTGSFAPSPFGQVLPSPSNVVSSDSTTVSYPIPYRNWVTVDLRSYHIDASSPFVAAFLVGSNPTAPAIMISSELDDGNYHSHTWSQSSGNRWVVFSDAGNSANVFRYLVRAYVHAGVTGVTNVTDLLPATFFLSQNFPNPFNPSTRIEYQLPSSQHVLLVVYDVLGRQIRDLVDEVQPAGSYRTVWDGKDPSGRDAASGVYFYQLRTQSFVQTNKMVLLR